MHIAHGGAARAASATRPQPHMPAALRRRAEADAFVRASCIMARVNRLCERARNGFSKTCEAAKIGHHHFARLGGTRQNLAQSQQRRHRTQGRYEQPKQSPEPPPAPGGDQHAPYPALEASSGLPSPARSQLSAPESSAVKPQNCRTAKPPQNCKTSEPQNYRTSRPPVEQPAASSPAAANRWPRRPPPPKSNPRGRHRRLLPRPLNEERSTRQRKRASKMKILEDRAPSLRATSCDPRTPRPHNFGRRPRRRLRPSPSATLTRGLLSRSQSPIPSRVSSFEF